MAISSGFACQNTPCGAAISSGFACQNTPCSAAISGFPEIRRANLHTHNRIVQKNEMNLRLNTMKYFLWASAQNALGLRTVELSIFGQLSWVRQIMIIDVL